MSLSSDGSVLGVDVGFSVKRKSSAVCRLDWSSTAVSWTIERFKGVEPDRTTVIRRNADRPLLAAAFDGPLRADLTVIGRYRLAEQSLTRGLQAYIGKPGQSSSPVGKLLNDAANKCAEAVISCRQLQDAQHPHAIHRLAIAEAFPSSFIGVMLERPAAITASRATRSDLFFEHLTRSATLSALVQALLPSRSLGASLEGITQHDDRAAWVCALSALCVAAGSFVGVGDKDGWIVLPPVAFIQPWVWDHLRRNGGLLIVERGLSGNEVLAASRRPL